MSNLALALLEAQGEPVKFINTPHGVLLATARKIVPRDAHVVEVVNGAKGKMDMSSASLLLASTLNTGTVYVNRIDGRLLVHAPSEALRRATPADIAVLGGKIIPAENGYEGSVWLVPTAPRAMAASSAVRHLTRGTLPVNVPSEVPAGMERYHVSWAGSGINYDNIFSWHGLPFVFTGVTVAHKDTAERDSWASHNDTPERWGRVTLDETGLRPEGIRSSMTSNHNESGDYPVETLPREPGKVARPIGFAQFRDGFWTTPYYSKVIGTGSGARQQILGDFWPIPRLDTMAVGPRMLGPDWIPTTVTIHGSFDTPYLEIRAEQFSDVKDGPWWLQVADLPGARKGHSRIIQSEKLELAIRRSRLNSLAGNLSPSEEADLIAFSDDLAKAPFLALMQTSPAGIASYKLQAWHSDLKDASDSTVLDSKTDYRIGDFNADWAGKRTHSFVGVVPSATASSQRYHTLAYGSEFVDGVIRFHLTISPMVGEGRVFDSRTDDFDTIRSTLEELLIYVPSGSIETVEGVLSEFGLDWLSDCIDSDGIELEDGTKAEEYTFPFFERDPSAKRDCLTFLQIKPNEDKNISVLCLTVRSLQDEYRKLEGLPTVHLPAAESPTNLDASEKRTSGSYTTYKAWP